MPRCGYARIGEILKEHGELSEVQVASVLLLQRESGRPFGELAQRMFGVGPKAIERAWVQQYKGYATEVDLDAQAVDRRAVALLHRRQAWQLQVLPLRFERHEIVIATTAEQLARVVTYAWRRFPDPVHVLLAQPDQLERHLQQHYPWPAMRHHSANQVLNGMTSRKPAADLVEAVSC